MNNPFDYLPDADCSRAFAELVAWLESLQTSNSIQDDKSLSTDEASADLCSELRAGKMLGVLVAEDDSGGRHMLFAFSGQLGLRGFHYEGFVGPVFDYLQPDGYFKREEAAISRLNAEISQFEEGPLRQFREEYDRVAGCVNAEVEAYREKCRASKSERDARRASGDVSEAEMAEIIRQSQFEKAELRRLKKRASEALRPYATALEDAERRLAAMKEKRRRDSEALQDWLFTNFRLLNARGESKSLSEIFAETPMRIPPSGAGECCAPKLLQAAYLKGWQPVSIAEYWYGKPKGGEVRIHGRHYPACRGKCLPVLRWMLQGLTVEPPLDSDPRSSLSSLAGSPEIIFENEWFCVVNKPSGMLSVPGKGAAISVEQWLTERYNAEKGVKMAHRLDQDTSGLLIATFGPDAFRLMQSLFATRKVKKTYIADLEGDYEARGIPREGRISLPLAPDWLDRPRQRVDTENGKEAVTDYEFTATADGRSRVLFHPLTGRTHQLRVHAASEEGLGMPIVGDRLYSRNSADSGERLHLHAAKIEFTFPLDGRTYRFESPCRFESPYRFESEM